MIYLIEYSEIQTNGFVKKWIDYTYYIDKAKVINFLENKGYNHDYDDTYVNLSNENNTAEIVGLEKID